MLVFSAVVWFCLYAFVIVLPISVAAIVDPIDISRPHLPEFGVGLGLIAYPLMAAEFTLVGRVRSISQLYGNDVLMYFHKYMGLVALLLVLAHPLLIDPGNFAQFNPLAGAPMMRFGASAVWLLVALAVTSLYRKRLGLSYGSWMLIHYVLALAIGAAGLAHILAVKGYTAHPLVRGLIIAYGVAFLSPMIRYRFREYFVMTSRPWEVIANRDEGGGVRTLVLKPLGHQGIEFQPGQFAWLSTGHPVLTEHHPISIASSAELGPDRTLEFGIRNLGDWSGTRVPAIAIGSKAYV